MITRRRPLTHSRWLPLICLIALCSSFAGATEQPWTPRIEGRVTDVANVLSAADRRKLTDLLANYEAETFHQYCVLTVPSVRPETIEAFSLRVANKWGIGHKDLNNGVLVVLAVGDRETRIALGSGMEKYISDATAQGIINEAMIPAFREGRFADGLTAGLQRLMSEGRKFVVPEAQR
jgi:uncharacterized protein